MKPLEKEENIRTEAWPVEGVVCLLPLLVKIPVKAEAKN